MSYKDSIKKIIQEIKPSVVDLSIERKKGPAPTQAFSEFLTNSEQGDWAETLFFNSLKNFDAPYIPVKYGKSDKIVAGDPGFKDFYNSYQDELDTIGKRPDILLFHLDSYQKEWGCDISHLPAEQSKDIVSEAAAGFEIRSSAYLTKKFIPKSSRPFLSFTPKVEDLLVVLKWIETYDIPHFYVQVFFDAVYIISFKDVLLLLKNADIEERGVKNKKIFGKVKGAPAFVIEKNPKNQYKETVHVYLNKGKILCDGIEYPELSGNKKELASGRLLHYVSFEGGKTQIKKDELLDLIQDTP